MLLSLAGRSNGKFHNATFNNVRLSTIRSKNTGKLKTKHQLIGPYSYY